MKIKKIVPILLGCATLGLVVGCGESEEKPNTPPITENEVTVEKVTLATADGSAIPTEVFDGQSLRLAATVKGSQSGLKVSWETSDKNLATVTNGVVNFGKVTENKTVTITAVSRDDNTKKASATFTIKHCLIDLKNSRGNNLDTSLFMDEGSISAETGDVAIKFSDVYGTKFYVEADVTVTSQSETDQFPKFGIMVGTDENTSWNTSTSDLTVRNAFFYCDQQLGSQSSGWTGFNFVPQNDSHTDWLWGGQIGAFNVSNENKWSFDEAYKIGLLRDGADYYLFAKNGDGVKCYKHVVYTDIAADDSCYAWIGGWSTGVTVSNFKCLVGDAANEMYATPSKLLVNDEAPIVFVGKTHQISVTADEINFNINNITYESDNEAVATVDANGLVTATNTVGTANITVKYGELTKTVAVTVTDDTKINVELDGKMNDAIWTEAVKNNKFVFNNANGKVLIDLYGSRNSKGVYLYAYYRSDGDFSSATNWWQGNNIELRVNGQDGLIVNPREGAGTSNQHQWWISTANGGSSNLASDDYYVSAPKLNEETNMYDIYFEFFIPFADLGMTKTDLVGFTLGSNDGFQEGVRQYWYNCDGWGTSNLVESIKIFEDGIGYYYPETVCPKEEHEYGSWKTINQATCAGDGTEVRYCKWCNHEDTNTIPAGEHAYGTEVEVVTNATCIATGTGKVSCLGGCGTKKDVIIPVDYSKHSGEYKNGEWTCCHNHLENDIDVDRFNVGGWGDVNVWTMLVKDLSGEFTVTTTYDLETNGIVGNWWRGILTIVQEQLPEGVEGYGSPWVTRFDWWGWCDQWQSSEKLTSQWGGDNEIADRDVSWSDKDGNDVSGVQFETAMTKSTITWKCIRTGTTVRNEFTINSQSGEEFTYYTQATDIAASKNLTLAFSSEFAKYSVKSIVIEK